MLNFGCQKKLADAINFFRHTDIIQTLSNLHDGNFCDSDGDRGVESFEASCYYDMLRVQILEHYSMAVQVIELSEYLISYLCDTGLREGLAELCQTVEIFVALLNEWIYNKERVI